MEKVWNAILSKTGTFVWTVELILCRAREGKSEWSKRGFSKLHATGIELYQDDLGEPDTVIRCGFGRTLFLPNSYNIFRFDDAVFTI